MEGRTRANPMFAAWVVVPLVALACAVMAGTVEQRTFVHVMASIVVVVSLRRGGF